MHFLCYRLQDPATEGSNRDLVARLYNFFSFMRPREATTMRLGLVTLSAIIGCFQVHR